MKSLLKVVLFITVVVSFTIYNNTSFKKLVLKLEHDKTKLQEIVGNNNLNGNTDYFIMDVNYYSVNIAFKTFALPSISCPKCYLK